jgi:uncharacterized protein (TIGR02118 family)
MIKVSVLYPHQAKYRFDMTYYCEKHIPMVRRLVGPSCRRAQAELGVCSAEPESQPPFVAVGHLYFDSLEVFHRTFDPHAAEILADIPNYTNIDPIFQISELKLG